MFMVLVAGYYGCISMGCAKRLIVGVAALNDRP